MQTEDMWIDTLGLLCGWSVVYGHRVYARYEDTGNGGFYVDVDPAPRTQTTPIIHRPRPLLHNPRTTARSHVTLKP